MFFRTVRRGARAMLQAPFPVNAARAGDLRAVTAWRQRCATTEANPVDARFPFDEWRPLQLACAEGDAAAVETILAAGAAVEFFRRFCATRRPTAMRVCTCRQTSRAKLRSSSHQTSRVGLRCILAQHSRNGQWLLVGTS